MAKTPIKTFKSVAEAKSFASQKEQEYKDVAKQSYSKPSTSTPAINTGSSMLNQAITSSGVATGTGSSIMDQALMQKSLEQSTPVASGIGGFPINQAGQQILPQGYESGAAAPITADDLANLNPFQLGVGGIVGKGALGLGKTAGKEALETGAGLLAKEGTENIFSKAVAQAGQSGAEGKAAQEYIKIMSGLDKAGTEVLLGKIIRIAEGDAVRASKAMNAKTATQVTKYITKAASQLKNPLVGLAVLGAVIGGISYSLPLAQNEKGDIGTSLTIAAGRAAEAGDIETLRRYAEIENDLNNPNWIDQIKELTPFVGQSLISSYKTEVSAGIINDYLRRAEEDAARDPLDDPDSPESWEARRLQKLEDEQLWRDEYEKMQKEITDYRTQAENDGRQADADYWAEVQRQRAEQFAQEQTYWENVRRQQEESRPSKLGFGLL